MAKGKPNLKVLRERVENLYREATGASSGHGAYAWIANVGRVSTVSVSRMLSGDQPADRLESILAAVEVGHQLGRDDAKSAAKLAKMSDERLLARWNATGDERYGAELSRREAGRDQTQSNSIRRG